MTTPSPEKPQKILVIEDHDKMLGITKVFLKVGGYTQVRGASSGGAGLALMKEQGVDLVICDWLMPGMDGLAVFQHMRDDPALQKVPFIMMTANNKKDDMQAAIAQGVRHYLAKPFTSDILLAKVNEVLAGKRPR
ncbi:MAG: response regulator [Pseudomonadota bacterium]